MTVPVFEIENLLERIQAEYREMPGLSLTEAQAARVWHLEGVRCSALLDALVQAKFLRRTRTGAYVRAS